MRPWIHNCSLQDVARGFNFNAGFNSMLIQIVDPCMEFPEPIHKFREIHKFEFLDLEEQDPWGHEFKITSDQAAQLAALLQHALENKMNVVVHCVAGVSRSGAVCEAGVELGFRDFGEFRSPNQMVKTKIMENLKCQ